MRLWVKSNCLVSRVIASHVALSTIDTHVLKLAKKYQIPKPKLENYKIYCQNNYRRLSIHPTSDINSEIC